MKTFLLTAVLTSLATCGLASATAQEYYFGERYTPTGPNSYIYDRSWGHTTLPRYGYYGYGYNPGYRSYGYIAPRSRYDRPLAPYGFGDRNYSGYNDPYYYSYGPGVREFLDFGGADFYGW